MNAFYDSLVAAPVAGYLPFVIPSGGPKCWYLFWALKESLHGWHLECRECCFNNLFCAHSGLLINTHTSEQHRHPWTYPPEVTPILARTGHALGRLVVDSVGWLLHITLITGSSLGAVRRQIADKLTAFMVPQIAIAPQPSAHSPAFSSAYCRCRYALAIRHCTRQKEQRIQFALDCW